MNETGCLRCGKKIVVGGAVLVDKNGKELGKIQKELSLLSFRKCSGLVVKLFYYCDDSLGSWGTDLRV